MAASYKLIIRDKNSKDQAVKPPKKGNTGITEGTRRTIKNVMRYLKLTTLP